MSISINSSMHNSSYSSIKQKPRKESSGVPFPNITEDGVLEGFAARMLPEGMGLSNDQMMAKLYPNRARKIFEFGNDGSIRILPGLSPQDLLRAQTILREIRMWEQGR